MNKTNLCVNQYQISDLTGLVLLPFSTAKRKQTHKSGRGLLVAEPISVSTPQMILRVIRVSVV